MPIYEYQCRKCGEFEVTQRITASALTRCPTCRGKVTKLISNTSFHLKGSGWYVTDYARKDSKGKENSTESKGTESKSPESKSESKSDTTTKSAGTSDSSTSKTSDSSPSKTKEVAAA
jgi:putative FmdB family regulatory protein